MSNDDAVKNRIRVSMLTSTNIDLCECILMNLLAKPRLTHPDSVQRAVNELVRCMSEMLQMVEDPRPNTHHQSR